MMNEKEIGTANSEEIHSNVSPPDNAPKEKKPIFTEKRVERLVAILLGITTLLSAWASWIGHLHGGLQSINFTNSNNVSSQATASFNVCMQAYMADCLAWNTVNDYYIDLEEAKETGNQTRVDTLTKKIDKFKKNNTSVFLAEGIQWMEENDADNPFDMPGLTEKYFATALDALKESQNLLEEGKRDNSKGDACLLVTVIYSLTLFMLGIIGTLKDMPNRITLILISVVCLIFAFIYMCIIPLPTGFNQMNFFAFN